MAVQAEQFRAADITPDPRVPAKLHTLSRRTNGDWWAEVTINGEVPLPDGRRIVISRRMMVKATDQIGRKRRGA